MIIKNTKIVFGQRVEELKGGVPLAKGDIVRFKDGESGMARYEVVEKEVDWVREGDDDNVTVTYILKAV